LVERLNPPCVFDKWLLRSTLKTNKWGGYGDISKGFFNILGLFVSLAE
jgi:hypothetical protein